MLNVGRARQESGGQRRQTKAMVAVATDVTDARIKLSSHCRPLGLFEVGGKIPSIHATLDCVNCTISSVVDMRACYIF